MKPYFLLKIAVVEITTRAASLRTQFGKLLHPKPSGSGLKDVTLTPRQKWICQSMFFLRAHIAHRPSQTTLNVSTTWKSVFKNFNFIY